MSIKLRTSGGWKNLASVKLKTAAGWKNVSKAFLRTSNGWKIIFGTTAQGPQINAIPTISAGSWSVTSGVGSFVLTGTNGTWSYAGGGTISQSYQFQFSTNNSTWIDIGSSGSISNAQTKTLTINQSDYVAATQYYRFSVTATANVDNSINEEHSDSVSVSIPAPTGITGGYVSAISAGTGSLSPSVGTLISSGGVGGFTLSWDSLTNVSSLVVSWTPSDTSPTSPQTYTSAGSISPTKDVSVQTTVNASLTAYGTAGTGGSFSAGWNTSAYANRYNISYSINGGTTQSTTSTGNSISLGSGNSGDSISVTITPYNTASGYSGTAFTGSGTIPAQTIPTVTYGFSNVDIVPLSTVIPYTTGSNPTVTNSGGTLSVNAGSWGNSPTGYKYVWQRVDIVNQPTVTHTTSSSSDSFTPGGVTANTTWAVTITASNSYGFSTTSYTPSYEFYVDVSLPMGGSVSLTGSGGSGTSITATTTGWSSSPTTFSVAIYAGTTAGNYNVLKAINSPTSSNTVSYTITTNDASPPPYIFIAYATATNIYGTSQQVSSNTITSFVTSSPNFVTPNFTVTPNFVTPNFTVTPNFVTPDFVFVPPTPNFPNFPNFTTPNFVTPDFVFVPPTPNFPNFTSPNFPNFSAPIPGKLCTTFNSERTGCSIGSDCASAFSGGACFQ